MNLKLYRALGGMTLAVALCVQGATAAWADKAGVTVHRGPAVSGATTNTGVEVIRGPAVPVRPYRSGPATSGQARAVAGKHLWLINDAGDRLTNCRVRRTTQVGQSVIRCKSRPLPRSAQSTRH